MGFRSDVSMIQNWGTEIIVLFILIFVAGNVSAQNVSVTDYEVPVSSADRLLVDFSGDHATKGSDVTASKVAVSGLYKRFYDSLPFGYSIDFIGSSLVNKDIEEDEYVTDYTSEGSVAFKKYLMKDNDLFGSVRLDASMLKAYDQPASALTLGVGYGRFIGATPLAKAVRIEEFLIKEGQLEGHMPKAEILELSRIIARRGEYEDRHGDTYKTMWYEDMEGIMRKSGLLKENALGAVGVLRVDEVIERERIADRFYGWDATLGVKFDVTLPYDEQDRAPVNLALGASYARPIDWKWQVSERFSMTTPFEDFAQAFSASLISDVSYELTNRIDLRVQHLLIADKVKDEDNKLSNSLSASFIYYIENYINVVVTGQLEKIPDEDATTSVGIALNYRIL